MASVYFDCPFCSYGKSVPKKYFGKKIKCPRCLATLTLGVPQPTDLTSLPLPENEDESPVDQMAVEIETSEILLECPFCFKIVDTEDSQCPHCGKNLKKECPFCSELIDAAEVHCPLCKRELTEKMEESTDEDTREVAQGKREKVFYLGLASLICGVGIVLGPIAIVSGLTGRPANMTTLEKEMIYGGIAMGITGTIGSLIFVTILIIT